VDRKHLKVLVKIPFDSTNLSQVFSAILSAFVVRKLQPRYLFVGCLAIVALGDFTLATFSYMKANNNTPEVNLNAIKLKLVNNGFN
jgi:hypothetical protein